MERGRRKARGKIKMSKEITKVGEKYSKRGLFMSRTFNSKLFLKLTSSIIQPSIICIQTLRYEPENRKLFEIELAIPWLKTFPDLMKFISNYQWKFSQS